MEDGIFVSDREGDFNARGEAPHPSFFEFQGLALCYTAPGVRDVACSLRVRLADWPSLARSLPLSLAFSLPQMYYLHGDGMRRLGRPAPVQRSAAGSISPHLVRGAGLQDSTVVRTAQAKGKGRLSWRTFALREVVSLVPVRPQMAVAVGPRASILLLRCVRLRR